MNRERFVSLKEIINRVHLLGGDIVNDITEDDIITYTIELIGVVGMPALFQHKVKNLEIKKHRAVLPCDFLQEEGIKCCSNHFNASTDMFDVRESKTNVPTYKIQGNYIVTSVEEGYIQLAYTAIKTDEEGYPMIIDDQSFIRALVSYIVYNRMKTAYYNARIDKQRKDDAEEDYIDNVAIAEQKLRMPTVDEFENIGRMMNSFIFRVNSRKEGFANIGDEMPTTITHSNVTSFDFINPLH